jgi:hypothetical protein
VFSYFIMYSFPSVWASHLINIYTISLVLTLKEDLLGSFLLESLLPLGDPSKFPP